MRLSILLSCVFLLAAQAVFAQDNDPFMRYPALSPDGKTIAFSWQGDIFTVPFEGGKAQRLTLHEAYESNPVWSPDGKFIAFSSDRHGNDDLFVMSAEGGAPQRLTWNSASDQLSQWTASGNLLFTSRREYAQVEREWEIFSISAKGGTEQRMLDALGYTPNQSPDGRFIVFARGSNGETRKGYRGPANKDIWLYDTKRKAYEQLTTFEGNDQQPAFINNASIVFISERDGTYNLYRQALTQEGKASGDPVQMTRFKVDGPRQFSFSSDASKLLIENDTRLYSVDVQTGATKRITVTVPQDDRFYAMERKTFSDGASEYAVSPNGKQMAFVYRGELFLADTDPKKRRTVRLTDHPYRDRDVAFLNDSTLIFASDREGSYNLYRLESADPKESNLLKTLKFRTELVLKHNDDLRNPTVSPDGKKVTFDRGRGDLLIADVKNGKQLEKEKVLVGGWASANGVVFSPDSKWIAYSASDEYFNAEVFILDVEGKNKPLNISMHPRYDGAPFWSPDGSKLGFISARNNGDNDVWFVWLKKSDWEKTALDWEEFEVDDKSKKPVVVQIDVDDIHERLQQVTALPGNESDVVISKDGQYFYFVTNRSTRLSWRADMDLHKVKWDGSEMKAITSGGQSPGRLMLDAKAENIYMMGRRGTVQRVPLKTDKAENIPYSGTMTINFDKEKEQIFEEGWRTMNDGFYDPQFHGADWEAMRKKYKAWAMKASTSRDFRDVFNMMLGELNASHLGMSGPDRAETQSDRTGQLGVELMPDKQGMRIVRVIPNTPADRTVSKLLVGEWITAVNGQPYKADANFYALMDNTANTRTILTVRDSKNKDREVVIQPTVNVRSELYDEWVLDRKKLVDEYSKGKLGYIHIQGMNWPSFERFERELVASAQGNEGVLIDVRFNGGGWTNDYLLTILNVRQHAYTIPRGAAKDMEKEKAKFREFYPYGERLPFPALTMPSIALSNENSYSNAEIFSHAYKQLGLGTLVGTPTFGAVISTGSNTLIDGTTVRLPFRAWYVKTKDVSTDFNMENGPAVPDIIVQNSPDYRGKNVDEQLKAAVDELLKQIKK